jgi:LmbE family N-acetylglucosaminyl deacetylase
VPDADRPVVFSPHLDDAPLSACVQLSRDATLAVTVFSGPPPDGRELTYWDSLTRATSSADRVLERLAEDDRAMSLIGCATARAGLPEHQYRDSLDHDALLSAIAPYVGDATEIWIPAGMGGHPDHVALRDAVLGIAGGLPAETHFYADMPAGLWYGWPSWVTGEPAGDYLDPDYFFQAELALRGLDAGRLTPEVFVLDAAMRERKEQVLRCYRSQLPALSMTFNNPGLWDALLAYEAGWRLRRD